MVGAVLEFDHRGTYVAVARGAMVVPQGWIGMGVRKKNG